MNEKTAIKVDTSDVVRTKRFELMDEDNRLRAFADVMDGNAQMVFCDRRGVRRLIIQTGEDCGAEIQLLGDDQASRIGIAVTKQNAAVISILDTDGDERFSVSVDQNGQVRKG